MSGGLRDLLGLPVVNQVQRGVQAGEFGKNFRGGLSGLNEKMQLVAAQAGASDREPLENQRKLLIEAFQKTSAQIDPTDSAKALPAIQRVISAVSATDMKASAVINAVAAGRAIWQEREAEFDDAMQQIAELEDAAHPKAEALRKLGDEIRKRVNGKKFQESVAALDQLEPKLKQIVAEFKVDGRVSASVSGQVSGQASASASGQASATISGRASASISAKISGQISGGSGQTIPTTPTPTTPTTPATPSKPTTPSAEKDLQASCLVKVVNNSNVVLTLVDQGHERGDFMTFPDSTVQPGATSEFVSIETPDSKEKGCKGFVEWEVGAPAECTWRVEWDNPEQEKNTTASVLSGNGAKSYKELDQIGQGDENVPTTFTISGGSGGGVVPPATDKR